MAYPTSRPVKTDWTAVDKAVAKEESEEKPEGEAALNHLFKQIYKDASEVPCFGNSVLYLSSFL